MRKSLNQEKKSIVITDVQSIREGIHREKEAGYRLVDLVWTSRGEDEVYCENSSGEFDNILNFYLATQDAVVRETLFLEPNRRAKNLTEFLDAYVGASVWVERVELIDSAVVRTFVLQNFKVGSKIPIDELFWIEVQQIGQSYELLIETDIFLLTAQATIQNRQGHRGSLWEIEKTAKANTYRLCVPDGLWFHDGIIPCLELNLEIPEKDHLMLKAEALKRATDRSLGNG